MYLSNPVTGEVWDDTDEVRSYLISRGDDLANYRQCATEEEALRHASWNDQPLQNPTQP